MASQYGRKITGSAALVGQAKKRGLIAAVHEVFISCISLVAELLRWRFGAGWGVLVFRSFPVEGWPLTFQYLDVLQNKQHNILPDFSRVRGVD